MNPFQWLLDNLGEVLAQAVLLILEGLFTAVSALINVIDLSGVAFDNAARWAALDPRAVYLIVHLGIPQCISMYLAAVVIRKLIDIIPGALTRF